MTYGAGNLPAFPLRVGCKFMEQKFADNFTLIHSLGELAGVWYNFTNDTQCYNLGGLESLEIDQSTKALGDSDWVGIAWNYLYCTVIFMPQGQDGVNDMFWMDAVNITAEMESCKKAYGIDSRIDWAVQNYGGRSLNKDGVGNIVFSNGMLDPWSGAGVTFNNSKVGLYAISTGMVGHHMDLMFSTSMDYQSVIAARNFELEQMRKWANKLND